jgi:hypothetical protein
MYVRDGLQALYDVLPEKNPPLQTGKPKGKDGLPSPVYSAEAALLACTANGLWKPPSFEGGGLIDGVYCVAMGMSNLNRFVFRVPKRGETLVLFSL